MKKLGLFFVKHYLRLLVSLVLARYKPTIIAVTGSAGKTTVKFLIYEVLKAKFGDKVAASPGSLSTKTGLPIALLGFKPDWPNLGPSVWAWPLWLVAATLSTIYYLLTTNYPKIWVLEFAADLPGDFRFLLSYIKPTVAVVTNVGDAHLEFFRKREQLAREKGELVAALPPASAKATAGKKDGLAVLNANDSRVRAMAKLTAARKIWIKAQGFKFNEQAARAVGRHFGVPTAKINRAIRGFEPPDGRFNILKGKNGSTIIDSSYNANPASMALALGELKKVKARLREGSGEASRLICVLGDMFELGEAAEKAHREVGEIARQSADLVVTVGPLAKLMGGMHFDNNQAAVDFLLKQVRKGDTILVKASHGMHFEDIVDTLRVDK